MKELVLSARRGVESLLSLPVALTLFGTAAVWTVANSLLGWLVLGPALVVLYRIALKALRGEEPSFREDNLAVLEDLPTALVAGILFALPFRLWVMAEELDRVVASLLHHVPKLGLTTPGIPVTASAALFIHFALHISMFAVIADRHCGVLEAARVSRELADWPGRGGSRLRGLGHHLLFMSAVLVLILLAASAWYLNRGAGWLFTTLVGPVAVMVLAAWHERGRDADAEPAGEPAAAPDEDTP